MNYPTETTESLSQSPTPNLPDEIWALVLSYLSLPDMCKVRGVSGTFYSLVGLIFNSKSSVHQWIHFLTNTKFQSPNDYEKLAAFIRNLDFYKAIDRTISKKEFKKVKDNEFLLYFLVQNSVLDLTEQHQEPVKNKPEIRIRPAYMPAFFRMALLNESSQIILAAGAERLNKMILTKAIESFNPITQDHVKLLDLMINYMALYTSGKKIEKKIYNLEQSLQMMGITEHKNLDSSRAELDIYNEVCDKVKKQIANITPQKSAYCLYAPRGILREVEFHAGMNLSGSNFTRANLSHLSCQAAILTGVNLSHADLTYAKLNQTDLSGSDLGHADLAYADLTGANLSYANLSGVKLKLTEIPKIIVVGTQWLDRELMPALEKQLANLSPEIESEPLVIKEPLDRLHEMICYKKLMKMPNEEIHQLRQSIAIDVTAFIRACQSEPSQKLIAINRLIGHPIFQPRKQTKAYKLVNTIGKLIPSTPVLLPTASQSVLIKFNEQLIKEEKSLKNAVNPT
jgi:hypothetical protein